tara:strand:- start:3722 stop:4006 length:285 start_codon:yes stop_codon:yes gene_type:complete
VSHLSFREDETMPIYTFIAGDGETLEEIAPMGTRDIRRNGKLFVRGRLPASVSIGNKLSRNLVDKVKRGYYQQECGGSFRSGYTKKQIKQAWGI